MNAAAKKASAEQSRNGQRPGSARPPGPAGLADGQAAASRAIKKRSIKVHIPGIGTVSLPSHAHLAWYCGVAVVAAFGIVDWPVAAVLVAGHLLAEEEHNRLLHDFGETLCEA